MDQQQINLDALVNNAKRQFNAILDQLYDIIAAQQKDNADLKAKLPKE